MGLRSYNDAKYVAGYNTGYDIRDMCGEEKKQAIKLHKELSKKYKHIEPIDFEDVELNDIDDVELVGRTE